MSGDARCVDCRRPIRWGVTTNGRRQPVDLGEDEDGNVAVYRDGTGTLRIRALGADGTPAPYERRAMPHAASCPAKAPARPVVRRDGAVDLAAARDRRRRAGAHRGFR